MTTSQLREPATLAQRLTALLGARLCTSIAVREQYLEDEGHHRGVAPEMVAYPVSPSEIAAIVELCSIFGCPIVARGAGTSLEGNALSVCGGLILDTSRMDAILDVKIEDRLAVVQPGVRRQQLNAHLKATGLHFPIDPGADATLGGMAACRASGTMAVKYGTMRNNVASCTVVLANGRTVRTAAWAAKSAAGYDLTALMVGSEGTLGIITELTVRLHPVPEHTASGVWVFGDIVHAVEAVLAAQQLCIDVARIELLDERMMAAINLTERRSFAEAPALFVEFHGSTGHVAEQLALFEDACQLAGGEKIGPAATPEARAALWRVRHNALYATRSLRPGCRVLITDVCVPISRLAECLIETRRDLDGSGLAATIAGHVGDGNFHAFIPIDPGNPEEIREAEALHQRMARRAIAMNGTCTGEHGIGLGKRELLAEELPEGVELMHTIKRALDPANIMNPQKVFLPG